MKLNYSMIAHSSPKGFNFCIMSHSLTCVHSIPYLGRE